MIAEKCINCGKSCYKGVDRNNNPLFGCNSPICVMESIVPNQLHDQMIEKFKEKNNGKTTRNN